VRTGFRRKKATVQVSFLADRQTTVVFLADGPTIGVVLLSLVALCVLHQRFLMLVTYRHIHPSEEENSPPDPLMRQREFPRDDGRVSRQTSVLRAHGSDLGERLGPDRVSLLQAGGDGTAPEALRDIWNQKGEWPCVFGWRCSCTLDFSILF
jgi:hypothetical protein